MLPFAMHSRSARRNKPNTQGNLRILTAKVTRLKTIFAETHPVRNQGNLSHSFLTQRCNCVCFHSTENRHQSQCVFPLNPTSAKNRDVSAYHLHRPFAVAFAFIFSFNSFSVRFSI